MGRGFFSGRSFQLPLFGIGAALLYPILLTVAVQVSGQQQSDSGSDIDGRLWQLEQTVTEHWAAYKEDQHSADAISEDLFSRLQFVQQELRDLRGLLEAQQRSLENSQRLRTNQYLDLEKRLLELERKPAVIQLPQNRDQGNSSRPGNGQNAQQEYQAAYDKVLAGKFDQAFGELRNYLIRWPQSARVPDALYWLGKLYLLRKPPALEQARKVFDQLLKYDPEHLRVPDTQYELGKLHHLAGDPQKAREILEQLIEKYPDARIRAKAQNYLQSNLQ